MTEFSYNLKLDQGLLRIEFYIQVIPHSSVHKIDGVRNGAIVVRVHAAPEHGKANEEVKCCVAEYLHISPGKVVIEKGNNSHRKLISVPKECEALLKELPGGNVSM